MSTEVPRFAWQAISLRQVQQVNGQTGSTGEGPEVWPFNYVAPRSGDKEEAVDHYLGASIDSVFLTEVPRTAEARAE